jgi:hypothetical protein
MAKEIPSVGDLRHKSEVTDDELVAATSDYMKDKKAMPFALRLEHAIDVPRAIEMHPHAKKLLAVKAIRPGLRRTMVMTAVILGFPVQG